MNDANGTGAKPPGPGRGIPHPNYPRGSRLASWQKQAEPLSGPEEEYARLRAGHPDDSCVSLVRRIEAYQHLSRGMLWNKASQLKKDPRVRLRVQALEREALRSIERRRRSKVTVRNVIRRTNEIATFDPRDILSVDGDQVTIKPSHEWPDSAVTAISSIVQSEYGPKVSFYPRDVALARLAKYLHLVPADVKPAEAPGLHVGRAVIIIPDNGRDRVPVGQLDGASDPHPFTPIKENDP